jgi:hypothetical protein
VLSRREDGIDWHLVLRNSEPIDKLFKLPRITCLWLSSD